MKFSKSIFVWKLRSVFRSMQLIKKLTNHLHYTSGSLELWSTGSVVTTGFLWSVGLPRSFSIPLLDDRSVLSILPKNLCQWHSPAKTSKTSLNDYAIKPTKKCFVLMTAQGWKCMNQLKSVFVSTCNSLITWVNKPQLIRCSKQIGL